MHRTQKMYFLKSNNFYLKHFFLTSIFIKIIFEKKMKIFEFFEVVYINHNIYILPEYCTIVLCFVNVHKCT